VASPFGFNTVKIPGISYVYTRV